MSHRRRILNLVLKNGLTGVHSLHRLNLLSRHNNLFYPTAKAAEDAASAKDPAVLFAAEDDDHSRDVLNDDDAVRTLGVESLEKAEEMRVPPPTLSFQPTNYRPRFCIGGADDALYWSPMDFAAVSESRTVLVDRGSRGAFLHDAGERRVSAMPSFPEPDGWPWPRRRAYFPIAAAAAGDGDDDGGGVYVMDRVVHGGEDASCFRFQAVLHRAPRGRRGSRHGKRWQSEDLPPPPYVDAAGGGVVVSYAVMSGGGAASGDAICVSTKGRGAYCFDTASRTWSKAGDWALPFAGKIEHDRELGVWLGFMKEHSEEESTLYATGALLADVDRRSLLFERDDLRSLEAPLGWHKVEVPEEAQVVSLGSGKFCVTQLFQTMRDPCSECSHEDVDKEFAVFTGVEVIRRGSDDSDDDANDTWPTELRVIIHKSKRYVLTKGNSIKFVL